MSVIVPVYNTGFSLLRDCVASVFAQSLRDHTELILFDDGSTIEYKGKLKLLFKSLSKSVATVFAESETNRGPGRASNDAVAISRGEYLMFLDSDDTLHPLAVEKCVMSFADRIDLVYTNSATMSPDMQRTYYVRDKRVYQRLMHQYKGTIYDPLLHSTFVLHGRMIRRSTFLQLGGLRKGIFAGGENIDLNLRLSELSPTNNFVLVAETLYYYRDNPLSVTHDKLLSGQITSSIEAAILEAAGRRGFTVTNVRRLCRALPTHASHYALFQDELRIEAPYFDYRTCRIRPQYL